MPLSSDEHIIDEKFKGALNNFSMKPSGRVWLRVARSLHFDQKSSSAKRILIIAGLLMLVGTSAGLFETMHHSPKESIRTKTSSSKQHEQVNTQNQLAALENEKAQFQIIKSDGAIQQSEVNKSAGEIISPIKNSSAISLPLFENRVAAVTIYPAHVSGNEFISALPSHSLILKNEFTTAKEIHHPQASRTEKIIGFSIKTYYFGLTGSFHNTWFFDGAAMGSENLKYQPTFGGSFGMQGGYVFTKHWGIQGAWILSSWEGQKYKNLDLYGRTTSLGYNEQSIALTYMHFPLLVQYKLPMFSEMLNTPIIFNITLGGQYGALISYRIDEVKNEELNNHLFRKNEFAALAGFDYDFMVNRPVFYSLGLRASYGTNIFKPGEPDYFQFDAPHNFVIGVRGAVNFSFSK